LKAKLNLVTDWAKSHREESAQNWDLARAPQPLNPVDLLE
jgi:hypothetical protein